MIKTPIKDGICQSDLDFAGFAAANLSGVAATNGVPTGGTTGQVLKKNTGTNFDTGWTDPAGGAVSSVFTRTGAVVATAGDYTFAQIGSTPTTISGYGITDAQPLDADLTTWAGITPVAAVGTWIATPSSANLRLAMTDENGTGALLFSGATTPAFTGITMSPTSGSDNSTITYGANYNVPAIYLYDNGATFRYGWGLRLSEMQFFAPTSAHFSWNKAGDFQSSGSNELMRLDCTNGTLNVLTGFQISAAAASGKVLQGNGTNYVASTPTWPTAAGTVGYLVRSDGTNFTSYPNQQTNSSVTNQSFTTSDTYLTNSSCVVAAGDFKAKGQYRCVFDMVKSAGTGAIVISVRIGTAGTTGDTARLTFTFGAGTSVADTGVFDVVVNWRTVGGGTSAVVQGICRGTHNLATTGLFNNAAGWVIVGTPSGGFDSSAATTIGLSFNGATAFAGTNSLVQAQLQQ